MLPGVSRATDAKNGIKHATDVLRKSPTRKHEEMARGDWDSHQLAMQVLSQEKRGKKWKRGKKVGGRAG